MGSMPFPLSALGVCLRLVLLLGVGPASAAAQARDGFTTAIAMATEAAIRVVTTRVYPRRSTLAVTRTASRATSSGHSRTRSGACCGITSGSRSEPAYRSDTTAEAYLNYDTERDPGAGRLVRSYRGGAPSVRLPGETWEQLERRLATLRPEDFRPPQLWRTPRSPR
jgi:hypothetical protein